MKKYALLMALGLVVASPVSAQEGPQYGVFGMIGPDNAHSNSLFYETIGVMATYDLFSFSYDLLDHRRQEESRHHNIGVGLNFRGFDLYGYLNLNRATATDCDGDNPPASCATEHYHKLGFGVWYHTFGARVLHQGSGETGGYVYQLGMRFTIGSF